MGDFVMDYVAIGQKIRSLRKLRNLSQEQLAEKVWISTTHMSHIETGSTKLSLPVLVDLANALEVGADEILSAELHAQKTESMNTVQDILQGCTVQQLNILTDMIKSTKLAMDKYMQ